MNKTLQNLFPDISVYENKITKFLEVCYSLAWSYRATGKELKINHKINGNRYPLKHYLEKKTEKSFFANMNATNRETFKNDFFIICRFFSFNFGFFFSWAALL